jgi:hypothetical protein
MNIKRIVRRQVRNECNDNKLDRQISAIIKPAPHLVVAGFVYEKGYLNLNNDHLVAFQLR